MFFSMLIVQTYIDNKIVSVIIVTETPPKNEIIWFINNSIEIKVTISTNCFLQRLN